MYMHVYMNVYCLLCEDVYVHVQYMHVYILEAETHLDTFVPLVVRVEQGRQLVLNTSCSTLPESLEVDQMCR